jgi:hypothetical protein
LLHVSRSDNQFIAVAFEAQVALQVLAVIHFATSIATSEITEIAGCCARGERPRDCRSAEQGDELAPS